MFDHIDNIVIFTMAFSLAVGIFGFFLLSDIFRRFKLLFFGIRTRGRIIEQKKEEFESTYNEQSTTGDFSIRQTEIITHYHPVVGFIATDGIAYKAMDSYFKTKAKPVLNKPITIIFDKEEPLNHLFFTSFGLVSLFLKSLIAIILILLPFFCWFFLI